MTRTSKKQAVAIAATALTLTAGAALASAGSAAAPSAARKPSVSAQNGWPAAGVSARHVMREARAAAAQDGGMFIAVDEVVRRFRTVDVGAQGASAGDYSIWESTLFSPSGRRIGRDAVQCTFGIRTFRCEATFQLNGRGKLVVIGAFFGDEPSIAITGGTADFRAAGGQMFVADESRDTTRLVFQVTG
jgi:hypothetical protein